MAKLFDRVKIGNMSLKNRIMMSPMGTDTDSDGGFSEQSRCYYERRAKGGFGLINTGCVTVTNKYEQRAGNILDSVQSAKSLNRVVESVHAWGAKISCELIIGAGRIGFRNDIGEGDATEMANYDPNRVNAGGDATEEAPCYAPSAVPSLWFPNQLCRPYTIEQIHDMETLFGRSALYAKDAGCDAITILADGGYLIDEFMSELWNKREDEYGGPLENRMRFLLNIIANVQEQCGKDFPIIVKFTAVHHIEGGRTIEEGIAIAKRLEEAGVAALIVDEGCMERWFKNCTNVYCDLGVKLATVSQVTKAVNIPVATDGRLNDPHLCEKAIEEGLIDFVSLGKQAIADPEWPNKVKEGRYEDVRACLGCCECMKASLVGQMLHCAINPEVGYENFSEVKAAKEPKKILVIGGGPGGIEAALIAAQRGHRVTIWEKKDYLGGMAVAAGAPDFKLSVKMYVEYLENQVKKAENIVVEYNKEATLESVLAFNPDKIVLATGSRPVVPPIPGLKNNPKVFPATEYLFGEKATEGNVVVIGAGLVGIESALDVAHKGHKVVVAEALNKMVPKDNLFSTMEMKLGEMIAEAGLEMHFNTMVKEVTDTEVIMQSGEEFIHVPYDTILVATGFRANNEMVEELYQHFDDVFVIGDAEKPGKIVQAVHQAYGVAKNLL